MGSPFFILLLVAAWGSLISLIEPLVSWLIETFGISRIKAWVYSGVATWLFGLGKVWSFNWEAEFTFYGLTFFDLLDFVTSKLMFPLGGISIPLFPGWLMKAESTKAELNIIDPAIYAAWQVLVRYIAPVPSLFSSSTSLVPFSLFPLIKPSLIATPPRTDIESFPALPTFGRGLHPTPLHEGNVGNYSPETRF